jgi:hypothetical protein
LTRIFAWRLALQRNGERSDGRVPVIDPAIARKNFGASEDFASRDSQVARIPPGRSVIERRDAVEETAAAESERRIEMLLNRSIQRSSDRLKTAYFARSNATGISSDWLCNCE